MNYFLEAELLYKPLCPSVGLSVCLSVGMQLAFLSAFHAYHLYARSASTVAPTDTCSFKV